ncbi:hypothetical protein [Rhizobium rhizogenes]|uniref:hypothetical protein n=1 Tax=Rhizobium rhizogenes TaxID=359 RepID=UPI001571DD73|nr:hypothetical protein [Rhizobium rhizogenes]NTF42435.1 hypothetical protein [Rhizobium rhizogenes]
MRRYRYRLEIGASMVAYGVILTLSLWLINHDMVEGTTWKTMVSLAPMLPAFFIAASVLRHLRRIDELQRKIQLEAFSIAFAGTALITFSYGFLENVGYPKLTMFAVWPLMSALWIVGGILSHLRYR